MLLFVLWQAVNTYNKLYGYSIFFQHKLPICNILKQSNYKLFFGFFLGFLAFLLLFRVDCDEEISQQECCSEAV